MRARLSLSRKDVALYRDNLFQKARTGDERASELLQKLYGVRVWSDQERATLVYDTSKRGKQKS